MGNRNRVDSPLENLAQENTPGELPFEIGNQVDSNLEDFFLQENTAVESPMGNRNRVDSPLENLVQRNTPGEQPVEIGNQVDSTLVQDLVHAGFKVKLC